MRFLVYFHYLVLGTALPVPGTRGFSETDGHFQVTGNITAAVVESFQSLVNDATYQATSRVATNDIGDKQSSTTPPAPEGLTDKATLILKMLATEMVMEVVGVYLSFKEIYKDTDNNTMIANGIFGPARIPQELARLKKDFQDLIIGPRREMNEMLCFFGGGGQKIFEVRKNIKIHPIQALGAFGSSLMASMATGLFALTTTLGIETFLNRGPYVSLEGTHYNIRKWASFFHAKPNSCPDHTIWDLLPAI
jgi:hypothetical protein